MPVYILSFQGLKKLREEAEMKQYAAHLEQEGLQELELTIVGTPASKLVDLVSAGVKGAGGPGPPSPSASSSTVKG